MNTITLVVNNTGYGINGDYQDPVTPGNPTYVSFNGSLSYNVPVPPADLQSITNLSGATAPVTLVSGAAAINQNSGLYQPASLSGNVFLDQNADGVKEAGDTNVPGVTVELLNASGAVVTTTTTDSNGNYTFGNLYPGSYSVQVVAPSGDAIDPATGASATLEDSIVNSLGKTSPVTLSAGQNLGGQNAGVYVPATVAGNVFLDNNDDGVKQPGDTNIGSVTVELLGKTGNVVATTTTDSSGNYKFASVVPGAYSVQVVAPSGDHFDTATGASTTLEDSITNPSGQTPQFTVQSGQNQTGENSGLWQPGSVSGEVFTDGNADGTEDGSDAALGGVTVNLLDSHGNIVQTATTATATDAVNYKFSNVQPGTYTVQVITPSGDYISPVGTATGAGVVNSVANQQGDIGNVVVASDQNTGNENAGVTLPAEIKSMVFFDGQCDGIYHVGDAGVAGVTVELLNASGQIVATTTTDATGTYDFKGIEAGSYSVQVLAPQGVSFSHKEDASGNPLVDSDVNSAGQTATFTAAAGQVTTGENAGVILNGNFAGTTPTSLVSGAMYANINGNDVVIGAGDNNVHTGAGGENVVVLAGNGNTVELGLSSTDQEDIATSCGSLQGQTQNAQNGFLFGGNSGSSYLVGGTGNSYLMGGSGANYLYAGSGNNTMIAGGNGSVITAGGASTDIYYQAGDGDLTVDNGLRTVDHLTVYGYSGGTIETVNGVQELVLSPTDEITFAGPTPFANGATTGNAELTFDPNALDAPVETLSFVNGLPVFTSNVTTPSAPPAPPAPPPPPPAPAPATVTDVIATSNPTQWTLTQGGVAGTQAAVVYDSNSLTVNASETNDGWYEYTTQVDIPANATNISFTFDNFDADNRVALEVNGKVEDITNLHNVTTAYMEFADNGVYTPEALQLGEVSGTVPASDFVAGQENTITLIVNNIASDSNQQSQAAVSPGNPSWVSMDGTLTYDTNGGGTITETQGSQTVVLDNSTSTLKLWGYYNHVSSADGGFTISGDDGYSTFNLAQDGNTLVLAGQGDTVDIGVDSLGHSIATGGNTISGALSNSTLAIGNGDQSIDLTGNFNTIATGVGNSTINAGASYNTVTVAGGNNAISVTGSDNTIATGSGNDTVTLGSGWSDKVVGGSGNTTVTGGFGNTYVAGAGTMDVTDFNPTYGDVLDLTKLEASLGVTSSAFSVAADASTPTSLDVFVTQGASTTMVATLGGTHGTLAGLMASHAIAA